MDYIFKAANFDQKKLTSELEKITDLLMSTNASSPVYNQLLSMLGHLNNRQDEINFLSNMEENKSKNNTIEIGTAEHSEYIPEYSEHELMNVAVTQYIDLNIKEKNHE